MLVIKRKETESILIGEDIEIIISEISQDKVKICINAPKDIKISRKELVETSEFNKTASEKTSKDSIKSINSKLKIQKNNL
nr:carbon storage regulator [Sedimentibacter sp.]